MTNQQPKNEGWEVELGEEGTPRQDWEKIEARKIVNGIAQKEDEIRRMGFASFFLEAIENSIIKAIQAAEKLGYERGHKGAQTTFQFLGKVGKELEYRNEARQQVLDEVEKVLEDKRPCKPYPNASNAYQRELDDEDKALDKILSELQAAIKTLKTNPTGK